MLPNSICITTGVLLAYITQRKWVKGNRMSRFSLIVLAVVVVVLLGLFAHVTSCPDEKIDAIVTSIPDPSAKHGNDDALNGWQYTSRVSHTSNETYYYYHMPAKKPNAPVFVLIHGMFLDGRTFLNFDSLATDFELFALETPQSSSFYTGHISDFSTMLQDFLDTIGVKRIYLGGVSLGGQIAIYYLLNQPKTPVDGLALITTDVVKDQQALLEARRNVRRVLGLVDDNDRKTLCILSKIVEWKKQNADDSEKAALRFFNYKKPAFYRQVMYAGINLNTPPDLTRIKTPTLIVLGDHDETTSFKEAKTLVDDIKGAELKVITGGGHDLAVTRADEVTAHIRSTFAP